MDLDNDERIYYGTIENDTAGGSTHRVFVAHPSQGNVEKVRVIRELTVDYLDGQSHFNWGYGGAGPYRTAAAVLADALELGSVEEAGMGWWVGEELDPPGAALCEAFREDFVQYFGSEWRLGRPAVLRWALGWSQQTAIQLPVTGLNGPAGMWRIGVYRAQQ